MRTAKSIAVLTILLAIFVFLSSWGSKYSPLVSATEVLQTAEPLPTHKVETSPEPTQAVPTPTPYIFIVPDVRLYSDGISRGSIRYVSQLNDVSSNGWGKYAWKAGMECTTACISMALSYLGIDASPEAILDFSSKTVLQSNYGMDDRISFSSETSTVISEESRLPLLESMLEKYMSDESQNYSPVLVYISGNGHYHSIVIIGKEGNSYLAVDPTPYGIHKIMVSETGEITTDEDGYLTRYSPNESVSIIINSLAQWTAVCSEDSNSSEVLK